MNHVEKSNQRLETLFKTPRKAFAAVSSTRQGPFALDQQTLSNFEPCAMCHLVSGVLLPIGVRRVKWVHHAGQIRIYPCCVGDTKPHPAFLVGECPSFREQSSGDLPSATSGHPI